MKKKKKFTYEEEKKIEKWRETFSKKIKKRIKQKKRIKISNGFLNVNGSTVSLSVCLKISKGLERDSYRLLLSHFSKCTYTYMCGINRARDEIDFSYFFAFFVRKIYWKISMSGGEKENESKKKRNI